MICLSLLSFDVGATFSCGEILENIGPREAVLRFSFPEEAEFMTIDPELKKAIHEAFGGRDYYTGEPIDIRDMTIDHIIPKSRGGLNNIFNYVPTTEAKNQEKGASFDWARDGKTLRDVRDVYGPKVMKILKDKGILDLRAGKREELLLNGLKIKKPGHHLSFNGADDAVKTFLLKISNTIVKLNENEVQKLKEGAALSVSLSAEVDILDLENAVDQFTFYLSFVSKQLVENGETEGQAIRILDSGLGFGPQEGVEVEIHPLLLKRILSRTEDEPIETLLAPEALSVEGFNLWREDF